MPQPPLGGCVLKPVVGIRQRLKNFQPPLGGCVLKHTPKDGRCIAISQPPLGGCVLKQVKAVVINDKDNPAAFRRLCVETFKSGFKLRWMIPAAFRRLCVETVFGRRLIFCSSSSRL